MQELNTGTVELVDFQQLCIMTGKSKARPEPPVSPSWADEDDSHDSDDTESDLMRTPTPTTLNADESLLTSPNSHLDDTQRDGISSPEVDVYALPPSGQVRERREQQTKQQAKQRSTNNTTGGARPKTRGKGPNVNNNDSKNRQKGRPNERAGNSEGRSERTTYAKVVTANGWKTVESKKRKFDKVSPKQRPLKGVASTQNLDIYLQGLRVGVSESEDEIIESVRAYCVDLGVTPVFIHIIPVRYDCTRTGCRLTVQDEDYERVIEDSFWPENINARDWTPRPRGNGEGGQRPQSDNEE